MQLRTSGAAMMTYWCDGSRVLCCSEFMGVLSYVKTLQGLGLLNMSMVAVDSRVQWFNGSVVQRRA